MTLPRGSTFGLPQGGSTAAALRSWGPEGDGAAFREGIEGSLGRTDVDVSSERHAGSALRRPGRLLVGEGMGMGIGLKMCIGNPSPQTGPLYGCTCTAVPVGLALHGEHVAVGWAMLYTVVWV